MSGREHRRRLHCPAVDAHFFAFIVGLEVGSVSAARWIGPEAAARDGTRYSNLERSGRSCFRGGIGRGDRHKGSPGKEKTSKSSAPSSPKWRIAFRYGPILLQKLAVIDGSFGHLAKDDRL
jgi:hypothetical protein